MSGFWPTPAAPGTVAPAHLAKVRELHGTVRNWLDRSATARSNQHLAANLPYADLMFAFGFATLGGAATANELVEGARRVLVVPIPEDPYDPKTFGATISALVSNFLFTALHCRTQQALAGKPPGGPLSAEILANREMIAKGAGSRTVLNPYLRAAYATDCFRLVSRIVEPEEQVNPYAAWVRLNPVQIQLKRAVELNDQAAFVAVVRQNLIEGAEGKPLSEVQLNALYDVLPLAPQIGEAFTIDLLNLIPAALIANSTAPLGRLSGLLERGYFCAGHFGFADAVSKLSNALLNLVQRTPEVLRARLVALTTGSCLPVLKKFGFANEVSRLLSALLDEVTHGATLTELRARYAASPELWASTLRTLLGLSSPDNPSHPYQEAARSQLLGRDAISLTPAGYTELARAYVAAVGESDVAFAGITDLFREMNPTKITNTWTTAEYYSRLHILLVEDTVLAVCRTDRETPLS